MTKIKPRIFVSYCVKKCNLPKVISSHLFGENHSPAHRKGTGVVLMIIGVAISKQPFIEAHIIHGLADLIGYAIHGLGLTPFIESTEKISEKKVKPEEPLIED